MNWLRSKGLLYFVRLGLMAVLTGFNFWLALRRWGWSDADPVIKVSALIVAGVTEIGLFAFLVLFHQVYYAPVRRKRALLGWCLASLACVGVSLYVNIGYFAMNWQDQSGNTLADLLIRALFPMALLLFFSMIPPKVQKIRTAADVEQEYAGKLAEARYKNQLLDIQNEPLRREQEERVRRRKEREDEQAEILHMIRLAGPDADQFHVAIGGEYEWDTRGLRVYLEERGLWPVVRAGLADLTPLEAFQTPAVGVEGPQAVETDVLSDSGNHRSYISAEEVAELLNVSVAVASKMMAPRSAHPYAIKNCKNIRLRKPVRGKAYERRAPYASALEIKTKMEADARAKLRPFPYPKPQPAVLSERQEAIQ